MRYLGHGLIMCGKLYSLALERSLANDHRIVDHEALSIEPRVVPNGAEATRQ